MATLTVLGTTPLFCFNRCMVRIEGDELTEYEVQIEAGGTTYTDSRTTDENGVAELNIAKYLQLLFTEENIVAGAVISGVNIHLSDETSRVAYPVVWGGISAGERMYDRVVRYYTNLNNPVRMWEGWGATLYVQNDNDAPSEMTVTGNTIVDVTSALTGKYRTVFTQILSGSSTSTFDSTFDSTFQTYDAGDTWRTEVIYDCATTGVYLKWIDNVAVWNYYMFEPFTITEKTKDIGDAYDSFYEDDDRGYTGALRVLGKTSERTQTIVASSVSQGERRMLESILTSPLVFWAPDPAKDEWIPVRIATGSAKDDLSRYADFECTIQYPNRLTQTL